MVKRLFISRPPYIHPNDEQDGYDKSLPYKLLQAFVPDEAKLSQGTLLPSIDVMSDAAGYTLYVEIPGVSKDDIHVEVHDGVLVLSGEKKPVQTAGDGTTAHVVECRFGSFARKVTLPDDADIDNITASHKNGVLLVRIPKVQPKEIKKSITITSV